MATGNPTLMGGVIAGGDLRTKQFYGCKYSNDRILVIATAGEVDGVIMNKPNTNEHLTMSIGGPTKVIAGDTVTTGDQITTDSAGKFVKLTPEADASITGYKKSIGVAMEDAVVNDIFTVHIHRPIPVPSA